LVKSLTTDVRVWVGLVVALWIAWTLLDYQGVVDLFPFFPLLALGFAAGAQHVAWHARRPNLVLAGLLSILVLIGIAETVRSNDDGLSEQRRAVELLVAGREGVVSYDQEELLVISGGRNPVRFFFLIAGLTNYLVDHGEVQSYVSSLLRGHPDVVGARADLSEANPVQAEMIEQMGAIYRPLQSAGFSAWVRRARRT
jgi:hypothetical protein